MDGKSLKTAVITPSRMARGVVTAISWFGAKISAFNVDNVEGAMKYLDVDSAQRPPVQKTFSTLRVELAGK